MSDQGGTIATMAEIIPFYRGDPLVAPAITAYEEYKDVLKEKQTELEGSLNDKKECETALAEATTNSDEEMKELCTETLVLLENKVSEATKDVNNVETGLGLLADNVRAAISKSSDRLVKMQRFRQMQQQLTNEAADKDGETEISISSNQSRMTTHTTNGKSTTVRGTEGAFSGKHTPKKRDEEADDDGGLSDDDGAPPNPNASANTNTNTNAQAQAQAQHQRGQPSADEESAAGQNVGILEGLGDINLLLWRAQRRCLGGIIAIVAPAAACWHHRGLQERGRSYFRDDAARDAIGNRRRGVVTSTRTHSRGISAQVLL
mmetsp:Transcript_4136/g.9752  ORF Transcript_4136/g.9752 Transcript_4136/m.9752 type:complete len:319 (+) Transcript_4136:253-1209(+)